MQFTFQLQLHIYFVLFSVFRSLHHHPLTSHSLYYNSHHTISPLYTGTVCIGTFGLRGSVTNDNAAAAIDAAGAIIFQLHKIGIKASIGE